MYGNEGGTPMNTVWSGRVAFERIEFQVQYCKLKEPWHCKVQDEILLIIASKSKILDRLIIEHSALSDMTILP